MRVFLVADDLTGAADSAAPFVRWGFSTSLVFDPHHLPSATEVVAFSTETRGGNREQVTQKLDAFLPLLAASSPEWLYCKIDSQLRGHPGLQLSALMDTWKRAAALVAPAFPDQGRVTRGGDQWVHGRLLRETSVGDEVGASNVIEIMQRSGRFTRISPLSLQQVRIGTEKLSQVFTSLENTLLVADAETSEDLKCLARAAAASPLRFLCGSAGLAGALAEILSSKPSILSPSGESAPLRTGSAVLVVAASYHPATLRQVQILQASGAEIISLPQDESLSILKHSFETAGKALEKPSGCVVLTPPSAPIIIERGAAIAASLARFAARLCRMHTPSGLILTGGDAASAVCRALGVASLRLGGEVQPGVPWGWLEGGDFPRLPAVTKSGGFGDEQTLLQCWQFLNK